MNKKKKLFSMLQVFADSRISPAELYRTQMIKQNFNKINPSLLKRGANRQWRRLHDPEFQTQEMIDTIDRLIPPNRV